MDKASTEKGRERLNTKEKFPEFNLIDYNISLLRNLNFYSIEIEDNKRKKEWAIAYWKSENKNVTGFARISDGYFSTVGAVSHMIKYRELPLEIKEVSFLDKKYTEFKRIVEALKTEEIDSVVHEKSKEEKINDEFNTHIAEFEAGLDMFFSGKQFDSKSYLIKNNVKPGMTKAIAEFFKPELKLIKSIPTSKDEQLIEGYSFLSRRQLDKYATYIQNLISSCEVASAINKASRKPRATKVKSPIELVKNAKYMVSEEHTKLKSEHPSKIVNATEVWLYNAKTRRLFKYVALPGLTLSVKGTTIINMDAEKSGGKIIRKPDSQLDGIQSMTSRPITKIYNEIKGTESSAVGRLNEDTIIVKCF